MVNNQTNKTKKKTNSKLSHKSREFMILFTIVGVFVIKGCELFKHLQYNWYGQRQFSDQLVQYEGEAQRCVMEDFMYMWLNVFELMLHNDFDLTLGDNSSSYYLIYHCSQFDMKGCLHISCSVVVSIHQSVYLQLV